MLRCKTSYRRKTIAALGVLALTVTAACSGSSSSDDNTYAFMLISGTGPAAPGSHLIPGAEAAIASINASGGVNGRQLKMEFCDAKGDPNKAGDCARQAAADDSLIATVGNFVYQGGDQIYPILQRAGIAGVGTKPATSIEFSSPVNFPIMSGSLGYNGGPLALAKAAGLKNVLEVSLQVPAFVQGFAAVQKIVAPNFPDVKLLDPLLLPPTTTDVTSFAASAISKNPDAISAQLPPALELSFVKAVRAQGFTGTIMLNDGIITARQVQKELGSAAGKLLVLGFCSRSSAGYKAFSADMAKYQPKADIYGDSLNAWLAVHLFADVVKGLGQNVSKSTFLSAMRSLDNYDTKGMTPPLNFSKPGPNQDIPRVINPHIVSLEYVEGEYRDTQPNRFLSFLAGGGTG